MTLESQIELWRSFLRRRQAIHAVDVAELEDHLRGQIGDLTASGLTEDEAFLVAVKRMGSLDALSREFAREHSDRLWKQLVLVRPDANHPARWIQNDGLVAFALAVLSALLVKLPAFFGFSLKHHGELYALNVSLAVLPLLTGYFLWKRQLSWSVAGGLAMAFSLAALFANTAPGGPADYPTALTAVHLPMALWLLVGMAYAGERWKDVSGRMDFIRFSGELVIYYVLIALGGGVFCAFMAVTFASIGIDVERFFETWLLPCGAVGALIIASWLVEAKQSVIENMAPVLTRLFTPLFTALLLAFLGALVWSGRGIDIDRHVLIAFDLLLVVVLGLLLYSISARDPEAPPGAFDWLQVVLVISALLADGVALWAIASRIQEMGLTPNRVAALGENIILLVNLSWSAFLYLRFLLRRGSFSALERWQTAYVPVYAIWAAIVVVLFPPLFGWLR